jgi:hypothetical protein
MKRSFVSEPVSHRRDNDHHDPDHQRKRHSHFREVCKTVPAGLLYHQVRLESCRINEGARGSHHQNHGERQKTYMQPLRHRQRYRKHEGCRRGIRKDVGHDQGARQNYR